MSRRMIRRGMVGSLLALLVVVSVSAAWAAAADRFQSPTTSGQVRAREMRTRADLLIQRPDHTTGTAVHTEALTRIGASEYHARGHRGRGVKVAVIDEHFDGYADGIQEGELPADLVTQRFYSDGSSTSVLTGRASLADGASTLEADRVHGVACAEVIYDVAPSATLYLIQVENLRDSLGEVFDYLHVEGVQVVSLSLSVSDQSRGDGQGVLAESGTPIYDVLDDARDRGMLIVKSAGNDATRHYSSAFQDSDHDGWHEFSRTWLRGTDEDLDLSVERDTEVEITLSWDDWGDDPMEPASTRNGRPRAYDLILYDARGRVAAKSGRSGDQAQLPRRDQAPVESISFIAPTDGVYHIRVRWADSRSEGAPARGHQLRLRIRGEGTVLTEHRVPERSLGVPADSASVIAVAAADVATGRLAPYSSRGPTADGRVKPDATSYTNVSVSTPRVAGRETSHNRRFSGTSAAAPHVAGMAALLWSMPKNRGRDVEAIVGQLLSFAADRGAPGKDNAWGVGLLQLPPLAPEVEIHRGDCTDPGGAVRVHSDVPRLLYVPVSVVRADGSPVIGLSGDAFRVDIGDTDGTLVSVREVAPLDENTASPAYYVLEVKVPQDISQGEHDLTVTALGVRSSVGECPARRDRSSPRMANPPERTSDSAPSGSAIRRPPDYESAGAGQEEEAQNVSPPGAAVGKARRNAGGSAQLPGARHPGMGIELGSRSAPSAVTLDLIVTRRAADVGDSIVVLGSFSPAASLAQGRVRGELRRPDGKTDPLILYDDGMHGDGVADDGVYGGDYRRTTEPGTYRGIVTATASLREADATVERRARIRFRVRNDVSDSDGDGLPDGWEETMRLNPAVKDALKDSDADGLSNLEEYRHGAHPLHWDTDGDGLSDGAEVHGHLATSPATTDTDLGGVNDGTELRSATNPRDASDDGQQRQAYMPLTLRANVPDFNPAHHAITDDAVWLATPHGLVRWSRTDGSYVKLTTRDGLVHDVVQAVAVDAEGRVWVGTRGGVSVLDEADSKWTTYTTADGLAHDRVRDIAIDASGDIWFATARGVSRLDGSTELDGAGDTWTTYAAADGLIDNDVYAVASSAPDGRVWVGTRRGVSAFNGRGWYDYTTTAGLPHPWVTDIAIDAEGRTWFATWGGGVSHLAASGAARPVTTTTIGGQTGQHIAAIVKDTDEHLWVHTPHSVSTHDGTRWATYVSDEHLRQQTQFDVPISEAVHHWFDTRPMEDLPPYIYVMATARKRPWYGIQNVVQTELGTWITYADGGTPASGVPVRVVAQDANGQIWVGAAGTLLAFDGDAWREEATEAGLVNGRVSDIVVDQMNRLWLGIYGQGVVQFGGDRWRPMETGASQTSLYVSALAVDGAERLWVGSKGGYVGLSALDIDRKAGEKGSWTNLRPMDDAARQPINDLIVDSEGRLWAASESGVLSFDGGLWTEHRVFSGASWALTIGPERRLWAGAAGAISSYDGDRWRTYPLPADLKGRRVNALAVDNHGRVWAGTSGGVAVFDGTAVNASRLNASTVKHSPWQVYTRADGLASDQIWAITMDEQGRTWLGTDAGVTMYIPRGIDD